MLGMFAAPLVPQLKNSTESIYAKMTRLALDCDAVNLGQGFPEDEPDEELVSWVGQALVDFSNQYVSPRGVFSFREAISENTLKRYGVSVDPGKEILVTNGAEGGLTSIFLSMVEPGDEIVTFAPYYMHIKDKAALVGAKIVVVPLSVDGELDFDALENAISKKTKLIVINSPSNPLGRVFTKGELEGMVDRTIHSNALYVFDDAYEFFVYDGKEHVNGLSLSRIRDRAIVVSSLGKTLCATGWRIGYNLASPKLVNAMAIAHLQMAYCVPGHLQRGCEKALGRSHDIYVKRAQDFAQRRNLMCTGLEELGLTLRKPEGGFFVTIAATEFGYTSDVKLAKDLVEQARCATIPLSTCFEETSAENHRIRLCFVKSPDTIKKGLANIKNWFKTKK